MTFQLIPHQVASAAIMLRETAGQVGRRDSQLLFGELFDVQRAEGLYSYGINRVDSYPGWVETAALTHKIFAPTHRIIARSAFVYPAATMKAVPRLELPLGAFVAGTGATEHGYAAIRLPDGSQGWVWPRALRPVGENETDPVAVAERLVGAPYLWGGRCGLGLDCAGLAQLALALCGRALPRDSDQQEVALAEYRLPDSAALQRGDLIYFPGHVGFMADAVTMLHANAGSMDTRLEALADFKARTQLAMTSAVRLPA